ncbi:MAG TPA: hypothetical protein VMX17_05945 [Candidatus Glassbacteria bacterium]|nr:hypothetical protein [Candidatus Glassbacteria bacterium]
MTTIRKTSHCLDNKTIPLGRSLFVIDELDPEDTDFIYHKKKMSTAYSSCSDGSVEQFTEGNSIPFERLEINEDDKTSEDSKIFSFLIKAIEDKKTRTITQSGEINVAALNYAFSLIESSGFATKNILMHPVQYSELQLYVSEIIDSNRYFGSLWGADIYVSSDMPKDRILFLSDPKHVGVISVCDDIVVGMNILDINSMAMIAFAPIS